MGVEKQGVEPFFRTMAITVGVMCLSFGDLSMEKLFSKGVTEKDDHKVQHLKLVYRGTLASPWSWPFWLTKLCFALSFALIMNKYDSDDISNEHKADFWTIGTIFAVSWAVLLLQPHILGVKLHRKPSGWNTFFIVVSLVVQLGLAITSTSFYFTFSKTLAGVLSIGWIMGVVLLCFWTYFTPEFKGTSGTKPKQSDVETPI